MLFSYVLINTYIYLAIIIHFKAVIEFTHSLSQYHIGCIRVLQKLCGLW